MITKTVTEEIMKLLELILIAVGLSMDAFAVSVCNGMAIEKLRLWDACKFGVFFGVFQALMPLIGYFVGSSFAGYIESFDHWIAFALLLLIGGNMIRESFSKDENRQDASLGFVRMLILAVATSIDALAVGVTYALLPDVKIVPAVSFIGCVTFALSALGVKIGNIFGTKYKKPAEIVGGAVLIGMGIKILIEHLI